MLIVAQLVCFTCLVCILPTATVASLPDLSLVNCVMLIVAQLVCFTCLVCSLSTATVASLPDLCLVNCSTAAKSVNRVWLCIWSVSH